MLLVCVLWPTIESSSAWWWSAWWASIASKSAALSASSEASAFFAETAAFKPSGFGLLFFCDLLKGDDARLLLLKPDLDAVGEAGRVRFALDDLDRFGDDDLILWFAAHPHDAVLADVQADAGRVAEHVDHRGVLADDAGYLACADIDDAS